MVSQKDFKKKKRRDKQTCEHEITTSISILQHWEKKPNRKFLPQRFFIFICRHNVLLFCDLLIEADLPTYFSQNEAFTEKNNNVH